ncbi:MAG TPA: NAD-dependent epimerase/dehydratase family protein, partial [Nitrospinota bacterium]|nr:NAD-dependent epimerase/dehydratase family protein [Nitrospinota bacterium]
MESKKVIVFGSAGFLGSYVAQALTADGHHVRLFDVKQSHNILEGQEMIVGDITEQAAVAEAVKGCSVVYNFAGIADIGEANENPVKTCEINVLGCVNILEAAHIHDVKRFVFASSVYVYSESGAFYRASKQAAERFIEVYGEQ